MSWEGVCDGMTYEASTLLPFGYAIVKIGFYVTGN